MKEVTVLGAGAFGTAMATHLASNGHDVLLWSFEEEVVESVNRSHENQLYLPGIRLAPNVVATSSLEDVFAHSSHVFEAVPVKFMRRVLTDAKPFVSPAHGFVSLSKGIENESLAFPVGIIRDVFGDGHRFAAMAGPNFAVDIAQKMPGGTTVASPDAAFAEDVAAMIGNARFKVDVSADITGVQAAAALKNVITLGVGFVRGAGYADTTAAFVLTRGLKEIAQLIRYLGGAQETVFSYPGVGDLVLTAMGSKSRNLKLGRLLGEGKSLKEGERALTVLPEGVNTAHSLHQLAAQAELDLPVCAGVYRFLTEDSDADAFLDALMS